VNGRSIDFEVAARDDAGEIGRGTHTRVLVTEEKFMERAGQRSLPALLQHSLALEAVRATPPDYATIGEYIAAQDPEAFALLQRIVDRPAVILGRDHFDHLKPFFLGYYKCSGESFMWMDNTLAQDWLLHTQSAFLNCATLQTVSLFLRVFGSRAGAFAQYKAFLAAALPERTKSVERAVSEYESANHTVRYEREDDVPPEHPMNLAKIAVGEIEGMIARAGLSYDALRIYVRRESLFQQVRFLFHTPTGWQEDAELLPKPENHGALIALHANVRNTSAEALVACGCEVNDAEDFPESEAVGDLGNLVTEETTFFAEYQRWKGSVDETSS
jgi:hypothetical protein